MEQVAAALGDGCRDVVRVLPGLEPDVEVQPVLPLALRGRLRAQLEEGAAQRRVAQGPGRDADRVDPAGQPGPELRIAVRVGRVEGQRRDGSGVDVGRAILMTQQGLPSGSASTTQGTSC